VGPARNDTGWGRDRKCLIRLTWDVCSVDRTARLGEERHNTVCAFANGREVSRSCGDPILTVAPEAPALNRLEMRKHFLEFR
jgi:hypothetical protein